MINPAGDYQFALRRAGYRGARIPVEQKELMAPSRPLRQTRPMWREGSADTSGRVTRTLCPDEAGLHRDRGQQCCSKPIVGHLHQGEKAGRFGWLGVPPPGTIAGSECMLAQQ